ncbi:MAG: hypothetical protein OEO82_06965 [Gammaproteobacteria bacterium]|nr:hypothetical protein [Gammaproteobacteria bacterium]
METVVMRTGLLFRLGLTAAALLLGQQVIAAGTVAGTVVSNQASVDYSVNGADQTDILSTAAGSPPGTGDATTFVVDNRVDFSLVTADTALQTTGLGQAGVPTRFTLTNEGNSVQDFRLDAANLPDTTVDPFGGSQDDNIDMAALTAYVDDGDGIWNPATDTATYVDELLPDASVTIWVAGTGPAAGVTGDVAVIDLDATVRAGGAPNAEGGPVTQDNGAADDPGVVQVVFADGIGSGPGLGDGVETDLSGYQVSTANLVVVKDRTVISDPFNDTVNPKAIPGAIVEYSVQITNNGTQAASGIVITDDITALVNFLADAYGTNQDVRYDIDGGGDSFCDATDGDATNCDIAGTTLTVGGSGLVLTVAPAETLTVSFRVEIPAT